MDNEQSSIEGKEIDSDKGVADGRILWDWKSRFPKEAKSQIRNEAIVLLFFLIFFGVVAALIAALSGDSLNFSTFCRSEDIASATPAVKCSEFTFSTVWVICYFAGGLGGTACSIKWLMHSVGTGKWHQDRIYWRLFVPLIGGVYSIVIHGLTISGLVGGQASGANPNIVTAASVSFLVGFLSDGVSGLLTNIANSVFGTVVEKK
jgi:hypothetical protein